MQKKKIFIEIPIPHQISRRLMRTAQKWQHLPVKWLKEDNLHITVEFIGWVDESVIPEVCEKVSVAVESIESFDIEFSQIASGPDREKPRLIWLTGEPSEELKKLHVAVQETLGVLVAQPKEYRPHVTLGRIRKTKWDTLQEKPVIQEKVHVVVPVEFVSVMESKGGGAQYISLEDCPLS